MVQSYLRYEKENIFGVIASAEGNVLYDNTGQLALAPALENVIIWHVRKGIQVRVLKSECTNSGHVTSMALAQNTVAVGYSDGKIRIFDITSGNLQVTLDGHRKGVEALTFNHDGTSLASGSKDTEIIIWDLVTQSGLYKLNGHRDSITCLKFINNSTFVVSSSKDTLVKVWDLDTQHCVQTIVGHRSEVWSMDVNPSESRLITCCCDNQIRIYEITTNNSSVNYLHSIFRQNNERANQVGFDRSGEMVACQSGKTVELYHVRSEEELKKKQARRVKRQREKANKKRKTMDDDENEDSNAVTAVEELELSLILTASHKVRSFSFGKTANEILLGLGNNSLEVHSILDKKTSSSVSSSITIPGHRSDVRSVKLSSDNLLTLTISNSSAKVWNTRSMQCIRTIKIHSGLCGNFAPGNRHIIIGNKKGCLQIFEIASGDEIMAEDAAHDGAIWSLDLRPDGRGIATGGADHDVKFWDFEMVQRDKNSVRKLSLVHTRTLKMADDVLCVKYSHSKTTSKLLIAVALLDCTVKVFYEDTLKFFVSLYGHKLPVMSMDISSDDTLLVTASADKNVKLWGLDFGDCHKSIFAHEDSIMSVSFVRNTHYFFTSSKDKSIKYWDGDSFERILTLGGHVGEVWGLCVSSEGDFVLSVSHDRSIRKWTRSEDQVFLEEEREKEMEDMFESELNHKNNKKSEESAPAGKKNVATVKAGERIMEALDIASEEMLVIETYEKQLREAEAQLSQEEKVARAKAMERKASGAEMEARDEERCRPLLVKPKANMILLGYTPRKYVVRTLTQIRANEMEEALLVLPFDYVERMIDMLLLLVKAGYEMEVTLNCLLYLLRVHQEAIVANRALLTQLNAMWKVLRPRIGQAKDSIGFNLAGLKFLQRKIQDKKTVFLNE